MDMRPTKTDFMFTKLMTSFFPNLRLRRKTFRESQLAAMRAQVHVLSWLYRKLAT